MIRLKSITTSEVWPVVVKAVYEVSEQIPDTDRSATADIILDICDGNCRAKVDLGKTEQTTPDACLDKFALWMELTAKAIRERKPGSTIPLFQ